MKIVNSLSENALCPKTAVALGFFDGVHKGHRKVLDAAVNNDGGFVPAVFTFIFSNNLSKKSGKLISSYKDRQALIENRGIELFFCPDFEEFSFFSPEEFVSDILVKKLNAAAVFCGKDYKFGKNACGSEEELIKLCGKYNIKVNIIDDKMIDDQKISSTLIKDLISNGDIIKANSMLGREYSINSVIIKGNSIGEKLGFPTINQEIDDNLVKAKFGVYISKTKIGERVYSSITNIGIKPTVSDLNRPVCETYIFDFHEDLYGKEASVFLLDFIRAEMKFDNFSALQAQIRRDIKDAKAFFEQNLDT